MSRYTNSTEQYTELSQLSDNVQVRYNLQKEQQKNAIYDRYEREKLKREIINEIMPKIEVLIDTEAIKQLEKMINKLIK